MPAKKIRILYVACMNQSFGVARFLMNYLRRMDMEKFDVSILTFLVNERNFHEELRALGCTVHEACDYKRHPLRWLKTVKRIVFSEKCDIVHANETIVGLPVLFFAWLAHVPVRIAHSHSAGMPTKWKKMAIVCCRPVFQLVSTHYFTCSNKAGEFLFGRKSYNKKTHELIRNAIETNHFTFSMADREEIRGQLKLGDRFVLGHIGRFSANKNHIFLLRVLRELMKEGCDVALVLVGEGETRTEIEKTAEEWTLKDRVFFLGVQEDTSPFYSAMDLFVLPSFSEGLSIVSIEAQANGLPCIVSDTVPEEAAILNSYQRLPVQNMDLWVTSIRKAFESRQITERCRGAAIMKRSGYDIESEVKGLQRAYALYVENAAK